MCKQCLLLIVLLAFITKGFNQKLIVATYNMRYSNQTDSANGNGWGQRLPAITQLIQFHDFDIFGTQECRYNQLQDVTHSLPDYTYIGVGRDDGQQGGEFSAVFYKKEKFKLLANETFWLSPITDKPNKAWDAALPRICSWGKFQEVKTGFVFYFFNLHMDHIGVEARRESAKLVLQKIKEIAGNTPTILTGDFNVDQNNESYTLINTSGLLQDAYVLSPIKFATNGTFNSFSVHQKTESRIDHIFLTKAFTVKRYGILTDMYWSSNASADSTQSGNVPKDVSLPKFTPRLPSDHYPVMIEVEYKFAGKKEGK